MRKLFKNEIGITLMALVITIIILLILAGITISSLTQSGLFMNANDAKERTIKAQLKEEIEMAIHEIQMEEIPEGNNVDLEFIKGKLEGKLEEKFKNIIIELSEEKDEITGEYKDYEYVIDDKLNVTIEGKVGVKPKITYELSSTEPQQEEITITVKATISEGEVKSIVNPDNEEIIGNEITYKVTKNGKYTFIAKSSTGTRAKEKINVTNIKITAPSISVMQIGGYPLMTSSGIVGTLSKVEIKYEDNPNLVNYYSEDNGTTWNEYKGTIETGKNKIMAKSVVKDNEQIASDITTQNIDLPDDAITLEAYDNDFSTYSTSGKINIDSSVIGKNIRICFSSSTNTWADATLAIYDSSNNILVSESKNYKDTKCDKIIVIPENAAYLSFTSSNGPGKLYEIQIQTLAEFEIEEVLPIIKATGIEKLYNKVNIKYYPTAVKKFYKIDDGEWKEYNNIIDLDIGKTIYAKSIDKYGNESMEAKYLSKKDLGLSPEAYDNDFSTYSNDGRINIDASVIGKNVRICFSSSSTTWADATLAIYDSSGNKLISESKSYKDTKYDKIIVIPENAAYLSFTGYYRQGLLYEIQIQN